ncbi:MAG: ABC transporter substrate-binding protein [Asticcacaulis sp.]|uniref:ABC transporter substrate-binding protein n=1 Tax=Asticcacaulis sp. TaxID=1872648 RepID=UPI0039E414EC
MIFKTIPLVPADTVWLTRGPVPTVTAIGLQQGWFDQAFARHGFNMQTLEAASDAALRSQHLYHDIKTLIREGGNVLPLWSRAHNLATRGYDNTVVVGLTWVDEVQVLLARPGLGLGDGDLSALKGKVLGLSNAPGEINHWRAMALRGFETALDLAGLGFEDVVLKDIDAPPIRWQDQARIGGTGSEVTEAALLAGEVDVIYAKGAPAVALQKKHNLDVVLDINSLDDPQKRINNGTPRIVTVHRHFLDDHPELVVAHLQVLLAAGRWAHSHPAEVEVILGAETGTPVENVRRGYGPRLRDSFDVNLTETRIAALQNQADFLYRHGLTEQAVDVRAWIDSGPLLKAFAEPLSFETKKAPQP